MQLIGDIQRAAVRLGINVQQHRVLPLAVTTSSTGSARALHPGEILERNRRSAAGTSIVSNFLGVVHPPVNDGQIQAVVLLMHAGRNDDVVLRQGIGHAGEIQAQSRHAKRIEKLEYSGLPPPDQIDAGHAGNPQKAAA